MASVNAALSEAKGIVYTRAGSRFMEFTARFSQSFAALAASTSEDTETASRILLIFEKRGLYIPRRHEIADPGFQEKYFRNFPASTADFLHEIKDFDYILLGSNEKNVDLQESDIALRQKIHALCASALAEGKLEVVLSGNFCHLL